MAGQALVLTRPGSGYGSGYGYGYGSGSGYGYGSGYGSGDGYGALAAYLTHPLVTAAVAAGEHVTLAWWRGISGPAGPRGDAYCRVIAGLRRHLEVPRG